MIRSTLWPNRKCYLNIVGGNHKVLFQTRITHADDDHKASKFLQNVHLDDVGLVLKVLTGCSFLKLENIDVSWLNAVKLKEMQESFSCGQQVVLFFFYWFGAIPCILNTFVSQNLVSRWKNLDSCHFLVCFLYLEPQGGRVVMYMILILLFLSSN